MSRGSLKSINVLLSAEDLQFSSSQITDAFKRLNDLSKRPKYFPRFAAEKNLVVVIVDCLNKLSSSSSTHGSSSERGFLVNDNVQMLVGTLANVAIDVGCRQILIDQTQILKWIELWLNGSKVSTPVLARVARLVANLARVELTAEDMFSSNIVFSLLKHAADSLHTTNPDCVQCIVRSIRILSAGRPQLLSMMLSHGGVSVVCRTFSSPQPQSLQLEILKTLKEMISTNCNMELAGQVKDSGILTALVETASSPSDSECSHLALRILTDLVQFSVTRAILGCSGCVRLFFNVIKNADSKFTNVEVSKSISGICYLSRECLTRLKMREQGYLPQLVSLLAEKKLQKHFSNIVTSLFCFSYDEPGLIIMVQNNLVQHLCSILQDNTFEESSHIKCSDKCQVKEKELQQIRPDLFSLDYGVPFELLTTRSAQLTASPFSTSQPGDISPPWSYASVSSPNRIMSPPRSSRQWLPFSQSPHLELSPNHYLSPTYQSSYSFDSTTVNPSLGGSITTTSASATEIFDFSDDEFDHNSVQDEVDAIAATDDIQLNEDNNVSSADVLNLTEEEDTTQLASPDHNVEQFFDEVNPSVHVDIESTEQSSLFEDFERYNPEPPVGDERVHSSNNDEMSTNISRLRSPVRGSPRAKRVKLTCNVTDDEKEEANVISVVAEVKKYQLTCIESNILHLISRLSLITETSMSLCEHKTTRSMLLYYSKLSSPNAQIQRVFQRLIENVSTFMELIRNRFPVILHRMRNNEQLVPKAPVIELIDELSSLIKFNAESTYNNRELYTCLSKSPIEYQFSIAVCLPYIFRKLSSQKLFFANHFALDLLVESFSKAQYLTAEDLADAVLALRQTLKLITNDSSEETDVENHEDTSRDQTVVDEANEESTVEDDTEEEGMIWFEFEDNVKCEFKKKCLCQCSDVLRVMLSSSSGFSEQSKDTIKLSHVRSTNFKIAYTLVHNQFCNHDEKKVSEDTFSSIATVVKKSSSSYDLFGVMMTLEMYNFISMCNSPEVVAQSFVELFKNEDVVETFFSKISTVPNISISTLNFVSIVVFQYLFSNCNLVTEEKCVEIMKCLTLVPQLSSLLLQCFQEKVVKFYFANRFIIQ